MTGGKRGRPVGWRKAEPNQRPQRQLRAFDDEWEAIRRFQQLVRRIGAAEALKFIPDA